LFPNESLLGIISRDRAEPFKVNATMFSSDPFKEGLQKNKKKKVLERVKNLSKDKLPKTMTLCTEQFFFPIESTSAMKIQKKEDDKSCESTCDDSQVDSQLTQLCIWSMLD
jgi:hypothetical protein